MEENGEIRNEIKNETRNVGLEAMQKMSVDVNIGRKNIDRIFQKFEDEIYLAYLNRITLKRLEHKLEHKYYGKMTGAVKLPLCRKKER